MIISRYAFFLASGSFFTFFRFSHFEAICSAKYANGDFNAFVGVNSVIIHIINHINAVKTFFRESVDTSLVREKKSFAITYDHATWDQKANISGNHTMASIKSILPFESDNVLLPFSDIGLILKNYSNG